MGFIEDEKRRRENLARETALDTPARREEKKRLERKANELKRAELHAKSVVYFRESSTPKLIDGLAEAVKGKVTLSGYTEKDMLNDMSYKGEVSLRLDWDTKVVGWDNLPYEFQSGADRVSEYYVYKSINIVFAPSGSIWFSGGREPREITYQQWKEKKDIEGDNLERVFHNPRKHASMVRKSYSEGSPTSERAGPGSL